MGTGRPRGRPRLITLTLTTVHRLEDRAYGPGQVRVPADVAAVLQESEARYQAELDRIESRAARAGLILPGGRVHPVAPELFHEWMGSPASEPWAVPIR